jgi:hypothetical protein
VGSYPDGASPYGCQDMAGNVWEWCLTKWRDSYKGEPDDSIEGDAPRVLRGGSSWDEADAVRCVSRSGSIRGSGSTSGVFVASSNSPWMLNSVFWILSSESCLLIADS